MRTLITIAALSLVTGCHGRFKNYAPNLGAVRAEVITMSGPNVDLARAGSNNVVAVAFDITQAIREGNIGQHIAEKVDPERVNQAFVEGFAKQLGNGPPFAYDPDAAAVLQFELVDWGMEMWSFGSPGVYNYDLMVSGYTGDGNKIYKSRIRCVTDAAMTGWVEMSPFAAANNPDKIKNLAPDQIQAIFDATASDCGQQAVRMVRKHAG